MFYDGGHVRRDVTVVVEEESHAELQRAGRTGVREAVPLLDALTGFAIDVPTVQRDDKRGKAFVVGRRRRPARGARRRLDPEGEGMRDASGRRGDLLIRFVVEFPKTLPDEDDRRGASLLLGGSRRTLPPSKRASSAACSAADPVARTRARGAAAPKARGGSLSAAAARASVFVVYVVFLSILVCRLSGRQR